jgi:broad specificity phosphatase PhoE
MRIILVRHGESTSDTEKRYGGSYDDHLTEKGKNQARKLAEKISRKGIEIVYASTLMRAAETAEILGKKLDRPLHPVESFRERNTYGFMTGMKKTDAAKNYPKDVALLSNYKNTVKDAESYEEFKARILFSLDNIAKSGNKSVAIVTHGGPISCIFREIFRKEFAKIGDCAFFEIVYDGRYNFVFMDNAEFKQI